LEFSEPKSPEEFKAYYQARWEILRKPLDFPKGSEIDDLEDKSFHLMVRIGEEVIGIGRFTSISSGIGQIRYMGVDEKHRGKNVGATILLRLEKYAKLQGIGSIFLNARNDALRFYLNNGYNAEGKTFVGIAGIIHTKMIKSLQSEF